MANRLYTSLRILTHLIWRVKWYLIALAFGSVAPDFDHLFGSRGWPHSQEAAWIAAGILGIGIGLYCLGLVITHRGGFE